MAAAFDQISIALATPASGAGVKPEFWFSIAGPGWAPFTPNDTTNGFRSTSGVITWEIADLTNWVATAIDSDTEYWIRIKRTQVGLSTTPVEDQIQAIATTAYGWDEDGDVSIKGLTTAGNVGVNTAPSGTVALFVAGSISGRVAITSAGSERVLTTAEMGGGMVLVTAAVEVQVPDLCDSATGASVMIVQADASEVVQIAVTDTGDKFFLDGVDLGANQEIDSPGAAKEDDYIVLVCREANEWHSYGRSGTWVDGGGAD